jgi:flagellar L-ring protein precursor FlgH
LWSDAGPGLLEDARAARVGDVVIVRIDETAAAKGDATTSLSRASSAEAGAESMLGLVTALQKTYPSADPADLLKLAASADFKGEGNTHRAGQLSGSIAVRIAKQMPNGDYFLEGTKVLLINNEEHHLYVSGLVRAVDIGPDSSVPSSRLADAQIEFTGRGDIADQNRKGWLSRAVDAINPF